MMGDLGKDTLGGTVSPDLAVACDSPQARFSSFRLSDKIQDVSLRFNFR